MMEYDVHTLLDFLTLLATGWVLFTMHTKLKKSYTADLDTVRLEYIVRRRLHPVSPVLGSAKAPLGCQLAPSLLLALFAHPTTNHWLLNRVRPDSQNATPYPG